MTNKNDKHFTAAQLAGLPGMPSSARGCRKWLERNASAVARQRAESGGGREYPITVLPAATQAALAEKVLSVAPGTLLPPIGDAGASSSSQAAAETLTELFDAQPENVKAKARARLELVNEFHQLLGEGFRRHAAVTAISHKRGVAEATLARYLGMVRGQPEHLWLQLLCPRYTGRTAVAEISAEALEALKAEYLRQERPSASVCIAKVRRVARQRGWKLPSNRTLLRRLQDIPRGIKVSRREGLKALKALYPAQQRDKQALAALQVVNGDGYKHNLWVRTLDGRVVRMKTWFWQDVHSSKVLAWRTDETEHTDVIRLSFGDLVERYGIPEEAVVDNTMAAANKTMSGGMRHRYRFKVREDEPDGVFKALNVRLRWTTPGHGQAKPIERVFGVGGIGEYIDKASRFHGAWTGSSTQNKPEYDGRQRAVELAALEEVIAEEIAAFNAMPGRRGAVHKGRSFDEVFSASYQRSEVRKATEAQRRLWLLATEPVRAGAKDGSITLDAGRVRGERGQSNRYWNATLIDHAGSLLVARFDPRRLHQGVHIYTVDNRWVCYAECDRPAGFNDANAGRERNRARNTWQRSVKQAARAEVRMSALDAAKTLQLPASGGIADASIPAPKVVRPTFTDPLERPRFAASERSAEELAQAEALERELAAPRPVNVLELHSDADKHAHWRALNERRAAGDALSERDEDFWREWQASDYFRFDEEETADFERRIASKG